MKQQRKQTIGALWKQFVHPGNEFRITPIFRFNDAVRPEQVEWQVNSLKQQGCGGLFTLCECMGGGAPFKFLSKEWWRAVKTLSRACGKAGLRLWVYDEEDWPSGTAGHQVTEQHPETRWKYICREEQVVKGLDKVSIKLTGDPLVGIMAFQKDGDRLLVESIRDLTSRARGGVLTWQAPAGEWIVGVYSIRYGKGCLESGEYTDLMDRRTSDAFIKLSYQAHVEKIRAAKGAPVAGFFMDEPGGTLPFVLPGPWAPSLPWTPQLEKSFRQRHGYELRSQLPLLYHDDGCRSVSIRCHFWDTCAYVLSENFFGAIYRFCEKNGVASSGHLLCEESFRWHLGADGGNQLRQYRYMHVPGMDWIHPFDSNKNLPATTPKYPTSVAHFLGRERTWAESFAASGWGCPLHEYRRIANWEHVNGINMQIPISYKYSLRGTERAAFYGPGLSYQQPFWQHFRPFADYEARLCALAAGKGHVAQVAFYYPVADIAGHCWDQRVLDERNWWFTVLGDAMRHGGYDFDLVDDEFLAESRIKAGRLAIADERFETVVLPCVDVIPRETARRLVSFVRAGGCLIVWGQLPRHSPEGGNDDPAIRKSWQALFGAQPEKAAAGKLRKAGRGAVGIGREEKEIIRLLRAHRRPDVSVGNQPAAGLVGYHRRLADGELYLLYNSLATGRRVTVTLGARGYPEQWDALTGVRSGIGQSVTGRHGTRLTLTFQPHELIPVVLRPTAGAVAPCRKTRVLQQRTIRGPFEFKAEQTLLRPEMAWNVAEYEKWTSRAKPLKAPRQMPLGDWCQHGLKYFSGIGRYSTTLKLQPIPAGARLLLDLGQVAVSAEVKVNGVSAGVVCFAPFELDITPFVRLGINRLEIAVANTLSNFYAQFKELDDQPFGKGGDLPERRVSGLLGPVRLKVVRVRAPKGES